jgi:hypothetical protein
LFNNTDFKDHELQHDCKELVEKTNATVHCLPSFFNESCLKDPWICRDGQVSIYTIFNREKRHLEFVCIKNHKPATTLEKGIV